jgi:membrane dipeptidase
MDMKVFDGHCDTILHCCLNNGNFRKSEGHLDLERLEQLGACAQFFAIFGEPEYFPGKSFQEIFDLEYALFQREMAAQAEWVVHCRTAQEAEKAWATGKTAAFLSVEGAELLDCDIKKLERAYELGVRAVNLTWNHVNALSGTNVEEPGRGLTAQGKAFTVRAQELGMLVDVSHLSDPGFWDVIELAAKPIFASHSNARALCPHPRNLTDEQFSAIIENHGVAGLNLCDKFLGEAPDIDTVVAHIEHWFALGGEKNVSLGGDWDGVSYLPKGISGVQDLEKLAERLLRMNYAEERVEDLFCNNLMKVVREVCTM